MGAMVKKKATTNKKTAKRGRKAGQESLKSKLFRWMFVMCIWGGLFVLGIVAWYGKDLHKIAQSVESGNKRVVKVLQRTAQPFLRPMEIYAAIQSASKTSPIIFPMPLLRLKIAVFMVISELT